MTPPASHIVFVGNIPYEATEEDMVEVFRQVGPVSSFRLVFERDTGKPRGFGFCEYHDVDTARSAVRNLDGFEFAGRALKVAFAESDPSTSAAAARRRAVTGSDATGSIGREERERDRDRDLRYGSPYSLDYDRDYDRHAPNPADDVIYKILESMNPDQLYDALAHIRSLANSKPEHAKKLLADNPQLAYAFLQAMLLLGLVDPAVWQRVVTDGTIPPSHLLREKSPNPQPIPIHNNTGNPPPPIQNLMNPSGAAAAAAALAMAGTNQTSYPQVLQAASALGFDVSQIQQAMQVQQQQQPPPPQQRMGMVVGGGQQQPHQRSSNPYMQVRPGGVPATQGPPALPTQPPMMRASLSDHSHGPAPSQGPPQMMSSALGMGMQGNPLAALGLGGFGGHQVVDSSEQQKAILYYLMSLTPMQVDALPPDQRQIVEQLRRHVQGMGS